VDRFAERLVGYASERLAKLERQRDEGGRLTHVDARIGSFRWLDVAHAKTQLRGGDAASSELVDDSLREER
jgi:hypothetical protein